MPTRRAALAAPLALASLALPGCGFHPLYMPQSGGRLSVAGAELAAIYVPPLSERSGQLLRQALQQRLEGSGTGVSKRYELTAAARIGQEQVGIQQADSSITRLRFNGSADWTLRRLDAAHTIVTTGTSRTTDGLNIINGQYFAVTLEAETINKRVVETLADQIVTQLAVFLRRQAASPPA